MGGFGFKLDASKMVNREEGLAEKRSEEARILSDKLSSMYYEIVNELKDVVDEKSFRIVAFIDDLDRCLPEKAVKLLEAIKLFLDIEGYLFVIGVDREVVKKGVSYYYRHFEHKEEDKETIIISPEDYLDKMIQLPLELPKIEHGRKSRFIESLLGNTNNFKEHSDIIEFGIGDNPRALKRFVNLLAFTVRLAETLKENILEDKVDPKESDKHKILLKEYFKPIFYIKWTIIVFRFQADHNAIKGNPGRLIQLQDAAIGKVEKDTEDEVDIEVKISINEKLKKVLSKKPLFPNDIWLIERFIHLTESTVISKKNKTETAGFSYNYKPGDMVKIPKGKFLYGEEKEEKEIDYDYEIDVFLVTNNQYKEFIYDTNHNVPFYDNEVCTPYCWDIEKRTYPEGLENHPVVIVSYEDAVAFCEWRSKNERKHYRLLTEREWEKAARGIDGREYPWGDEFDFNKLNCSDYHVKKTLKNIDKWKEIFKEIFYKENKGKTLTTEVERFPDGVSPFGCMDMSGNVWECTSSKYDKSKFVLRGGSWSDQSVFCRCTYRSSGILGIESRFPIVGFRCARTLKL